MDHLWIPVTLAAALAQTGRNAAQRGLTERLGTLGATNVRFLFGLPFACAFLALALHGVVEFNFTIPSICVLLAQTLGLAWAAGAWRSAHEDAAQGG